MERERWRDGDERRKRVVRLIVSIVSGKRDVAQAQIEAAASEEQQCPRRYSREVGRA